MDEEFRALVSKLPALLERLCECEPHMLSGDLPTDMPKVPDGPMSWTQRTSNGAGNGIPTTNPTSATAAVGRATTARRRTEFRGAAGFGVQRLLGCPQGFFCRPGGDDDQAREIDAKRGKRRRVRQMRRRDPNEGAFLRRQCGERCAQYAQLADAFMPRHDFGQCRGRPAAAGQLCIERGKTGRHARAGDAA